MAERRAVTKQMARRYQEASKGEKSVLLDQLCSLTGWTRRHARRALKQAGRGEPRHPRAPRTRIYGEEVLAPLRVVWATLDGLTGKRLAPFMAEAVQALERSGELHLDPEVRTKLLRVSAATIDRALAPERRRLQAKGSVGTKPGTLLKRQIPIRTFAQWDETRPGFCEVDLVAHDGGSPSGEFCQTLDLTCVNTGWTEMRALRNKAQRWCFEALLDIRSALPFPLLGLDSDNGGEFINNQLFTYCLEQEITFTRSRAYRKNDNCFVEEKNWSVIRRHVGYPRYDTPEELAVLHELYSHLRLFVNFFQPQMRLVQKTRDGARVTRRYDGARTPYQRILDSPEVSEEAKHELTGVFLTLNPAQLKRDIGRCQDRLLEVGAHKPKRKEVGPPPGHPWVNFDFGKGQISRTSFVSQRMATSRTS